jgi:peptidoglycan/xylan/chitin deacetylase (PgdA/CDA1 family)
MLTNDGATRRRTMRDFVGYGGAAPSVEWPDRARLALSFVVNVEEGAEPSPADGDARAESRAEMPHGARDGVRDLAIESQYEYGSRAGLWRILEVLSDKGVRATFAACGRALERNPTGAAAIVASGHEVCSHGYEWREPSTMTRDEERRAIRRAVEAIETTTGRRPVGWYSRWGPSVHTRELLVEEGGFLYDSDAYNDDLPYEVAVSGRPFVVLPYAMDTNDMKFWLGGFALASQFAEYLRDTFDVLYAEGAHRPRMMSVGIHARILGRPGRIRALTRFLEHVSSHEGVWIARRDEIARHWLARRASAR